MSDKYEAPKRYTALNDVTGDLIKSRTDGQDKFAEGWDRIFGNKKAPPATPEQEAFKEKLMERMICNSCKGTQWKDEYINGQWNKVLCPYCTGVAYTTHDDRYYTDNDE